MLQLSKGEDRKKQEGKSKVTPVVAPTGSVGASELAAAATSGKHFSQSITNETLNQYGPLSHAQWNHNPVWGRSRG
jgi:hypothetical protein